MLSYAEIVSRFDSPTIGAVIRRSSCSATQRLLERRAVLDAKGFPRRSSCSATQRLLERHLDLQHIRAIRLSGSSGRLSLRVRTRDVNYFFSWYLSFRGLNCGERSGYPLLHVTARNILTCANVAIFFQPTRRAHQHLTGRC